MPPAIGKLWARASEQLRAFTAMQRVAMGAAAIGVVVAVLVFSRWSGKPDMAALYTDLQPTDAASITEKLSNDGVDYELADQGTTVMVPRDKLYSLRLKLSAAGLPASGSGGWSVLDKQGLTTSEFSQRVGYQRAMEGELARTVSSLDVVQTATVHLVIPSRDAFVLEDTKASASVLVRTRPGKSLNSSQVQAIVNLVSSSVQGLTPAAVTVADTTGAVLNAPGNSVAAGTAGSTRLEQTNSFEQALSTDIQAMLATVVGTGKAVVRVNADLDFDSKTSTSETYNSPSADGKMPTAESTRTEEYKGAVPSNSGVLGPVASAGAAGNDTSYKLDDKQSTYAVNRVVATTEQAPGAIRRLSVAVLVDEGAVNATQATQIEQLVGAAAGIDATRGDQVVISRLPFDTSAASENESELAAVEAQQQREARMRLIATIGAVVVVLSVLAFASRAIVKAQRRRTPFAGSVDLRDQPEPLDADFEAFEAELRAPAELEPAVPPTEEEIIHARLGSQVSSLVEQQPEEVALLLRSWLGDRRTSRR